MKHDMDWRRSDERIGYAALPVVRRRRRRKHSESVFASVGSPSAA